MLCRCTEFHSVLFYCSVYYCIMLCCVVLLAGNVRLPHVAQLRPKRLRTGSICLLRLLEGLSDYVPDTWGPFRNHLRPRYSIWKFVAPLSLLCCMESREEHHQKLSLSEKFREVICKRPSEAFTSSVVHLSSYHTVSLGTQLQRDCPPTPHQQKQEPKYSITHPASKFWAAAEGLSGGLRGHAGQGQDCS